MVGSIALFLGYLSLFALHDTDSVEITFQNNVGESIIVEAGSDEFELEDGDSITYLFPEKKTLSVVARTREGDLLLDQTYSPESLEEIQQRIVFSRP